MRVKRKPAGVNGLPGGAIPMVFGALIVLMTALAPAAVHAEDDNALLDFFRSQAKLRAETQDLKKQQAATPGGQKDKRRRHSAAQSASDDEKPKAKPKKRAPAAEAATASTEPTGSTPNSRKKNRAAESAATSDKPDKPAKSDAAEKKTDKSERTASLAGTAGYIRADRGPVAKVLGEDLTKKIFSQEFTPVRHLAITRSAQIIPGYKCPGDPPVALTDILAFPIKAATTSWVERYIVGCTPNAKRNFLVMIEDGKPQIAELLPGASAADPILQRDAVANAEAFVKSELPAGCDHTVFTDTRLAEPRVINKPWVEVWSYDQCGHEGKLEMTFSPIADGGTSFTPKIIR